MPKSLKTVTTTTVRATTTIGRSKHFMQAAKTNKSKNIVYSFAPTTAKPSTPIKKTKPKQKKKKKKVSNEVARKTYYNKRA